MKKVIALFLVLVSCLGFCVFASNETVISLSYLNGTIKPQLEDEVEKTVLSMFDTVKVPDTNVFSNAGVQRDVANRVLERLQMKGFYMYSTEGRQEVVLKKDDVLSGLTGTTLILRSGSAKVINDTIVNITGGNEAKSGAGVAQNTNYMIPKSSGAGIRITSDRATVWVDGVYRIVSLRYRAKYFDRADALKAMNLFRGSNIGYELDRAATRAESLVMLLRLLGEEDEALRYNGKHPFTDVPEWVDRYVAYAYNRGYTNGISKTLFGSGNTTSANHYMTFLLRTLGYNDANGDFKWDKAIDFAKNAGNITAGEHQLITKESFMRDHMTYLSYHTLFAKLKGSESTLLDKLINEKTVSRSVADRAIAKMTSPRL
ncbi:MAG: hypothetical protein IKU84_00125 [Clostridia bacterium]|nr:hypothetical protein [Clostridia bacterium]